MVVNIFNILKEYISHILVCDHVFTYTVYHISQSLYPTSLGSTTLHSEIKSKSNYKENSYMNMLLIIKQ